LFPLKVSNREKKLKEKRKCFLDEKKFCQKSVIMKNHCQKTIINDCSKSKKRNKDKPSAGSKYEVPEQILKVYYGWSL
jgi:hypothetical protein